MGGKRVGRKRTIWVSLTHMITGTTARPRRKYIKRFPGVARRHGLQRRHKKRGPR